MSLLVFAATSWVLVESPKAKTAPRYAGGRHVLVSLARGPILESDTSQGVDVATWAAWQAPDKSLHLSLLNGSQSRLSPAPFGFETFSDRLDRISLSFDQNGRRVLALSSGGSISLSRLLPGPIESRVTWAGVDCLLWFDGLFRDVAGGEPTDVIAFYLPASRDAILYRIQSENFAIERTYIALSQTSSLDHIVLSQNRLVLYATGKDKVASTSSVVSERYPLRFADAMQVGASIISGVDALVIVSPDSNADSMQVGASLLSGIDLPVITSPDPSTDSMQVSASLLSGSDVLVITSPDSNADSMQVGASLLSGLDTLVLVTSDPLAESMTVGASLISGSIT